MSAEHSPEAASAADEVIDAIAAIETQRRETEKEAGLAGRTAESRSREQVADDKGSGRRPVRRNA